MHIEEQVLQHDISEILHFLHLYNFLKKNQYGDSDQ